MAPKAKRIKEVEIGDVYRVPKTVSAKEETLNGWKLTFEDGTFIEFQKTNDPAIEVESG